MIMRWCKVFCCIFLFVGLAMFGMGCSSSDDTDDTDEETESIIGSWMAVDTKPGDPDKVSFLTFLDDSHFVTAWDIMNNSSKDQHDGVEFGTYTWDSATGAFAYTNVIVDTNGDDLGSTGEIGTFKVSGNTLTAIGPKGDTATATRIYSSANQLIGSWLLEMEGEGTEVFTFLDDSHFALALYNEQDTANAGVQFGTYTWDSATGAFAVSDRTVNTVQGSLALDSLDIKQLKVSGDTLSMFDYSGESFTLTGVQ